MPTATIQIKPKNPLTTWVALDIDNKIICEGTKPELVQREAKKKTNVFFMMYIPKKNTTYFL